MKNINFPDSVLELIRALRKLPGVGPRSAERIAVWMIQNRKANPQTLAEALVNADKEVELCRICGFFSESDSCSVCEAVGRNEQLLCVVEQPTDVLPLERSNAYKGYFHCLGGKLAPLDNVTPDDLNISSLLERVKSKPGTEVILALTADVEGEATANYIAELLEGLDCVVTRIAQGLPAGGGLESVDELTLMRALQGRR